MNRPFQSESQHRIGTVRRKIAVLTAGLLLGAVGGTAPTVRAADERAWSTPATVVPAPGLQKPAQPQPVIHRSSKIEFPFLQADSPDIAMTTASNTAQSENSVFMDPMNPLRLLNSNNSHDWPSQQFLGADYWVSTDGGQTWTGSVNGAGGFNNGDPATAINRNGRMFVNFIAPDYGQGIAYSDNGGSSWSTAQVAPGPYLLDKNHMWVDNSASSAYVGHLYVTWTNLQGGSPNYGEIELRRSTNNGTAWSSTFNLSGAVNAGSHNQGVNVQTGPNGEVYVAWSIYDAFPADETAIGFAKSTNGGASWPAATRIQTGIRGHRNTPLGGGKTMRHNSFPSMTVNQQTGQIFIVWTNIGVPGVNSGDPDIYLISSTNGGATWSTPRRVNQDPQGNGKDQWFPWIACDPTTGLLACIFYDSRNFAGNDMAETWVAVSSDNGQTWSDSRVSDVAWSGDAIYSSYAGDYIGIVSRDNKVYPVWCDTRAGNMLVYTSPFQVQQGPPPGYVEQILPTSTVAGLAISPQGKPSITYLTPSTNRPQYAARANNTWTSSQIEDLPVQLTAVAADAAGNAHVTYLDRTNPDPSLRPLRYAKRSGGGAWVAEMVDATVQGFNGTTTSDLTLNAAGTPWVAYADDDGLVRAAYRGPTGGWTPEQAGLGGGSRGEEFVNIAISPAGTVFVSYCDGFDKRLYCAIRNAPNNWSRELVDTPPSNLEAVANSLRLNAAGQPVIAYFVPGQDQLKVATRIGASNWSSQLVANNLSWTTGVNPELDIDSTGDLHLVYNNWRMQQKIYAKRTGPTSWSFLTLNGLAAPNPHFMRVSASGKPRIASGSVFWDSAWDIVTPVNGATWAAGSNQLVSWAGTGTANVEARRTPASAYVMLAANVVADETSVTVPEWVTSTAQVRVSRISPAASATASPININVNPPVLTSPVGGEQWVPGTVQTVTWTGDGPVKIELFADVTAQGQTLTGPSQLLVANAPGNSAMVTVPVMATTRARIQISRVVDGTTFASFSPNRFKVGTPPVAGSWLYSLVEPPNHGHNQMSVISNGGTGVEAVYYDLVSTSLKHASRASETAPWVVTEVENAGLSGSWPSIARGSDGRLHVAYYETTIGSATLRYRVRTGSTWSGATIVATVGVTQGNCWITLDRNGVPHIAYSTGNSGGQTLRVVKLSGANWVQVGGLLPAGSWPHHITMRADANADVLWVGAIDLQGTRLSLWKYTTSWSRVTPIDELSTYKSASLSLDSAQRPWLAYTLPGSAPGSQKLMLQDWGGPGTIPPIEVDTSVGTIAGVSLTHVGLLPRIAYVGNGVAKLAMRDGAGVWSTGVADMTGDMDAQISLAITEAERRWIIYRDLATNAVKSAVQDVVPPAPSPYLNTAGGCDSIFVDWQSTGDDGNSGIATVFDLRWSGSAILNDAAFNGSQTVPVTLPAPGLSGTQHRIAIYMGPCSSQKYFGLKIRDNAGNLSALTSNPYGAQTACVQPPLMCWDAKTRRDEPLPASTEIASLRPNPTSGSLDLHVALAAAEAGAPLDLSVYDVAGRRVATLRNLNPGAGRHVVRWDLRDATGRDVSAGIYFVRLRVATKTLTRRVVVVR